MSRILRAFVVVGISVSAAPSQAQELIDAVVATVDREAILYSDLIAEIGPELNDLQQAAATPEAFQQQADQLLDATLEQAIQSRILLRQAELLGAEVEEDQVDEAVQQLRALYDTNEQFLNELEAVGLTIAEFRDLQRRKILAARMARSKLDQLAGEISITESEVQEYYSENSDRFSRPERVRVRQIFLSAGNDPAERARTRARLETVVEELEAGADFAGLAETYSQAPGAAEGGIIGWVQRGELVPALEEAAFALEEGDISPIIESNTGFHVLKIEEHEEAGSAAYDEVRTEIEPMLRQQIAQERFEKWMADLRKRSQVRVFL